MRVSVNDLSDGVLSGCEPKRKLSFHVQRIKSAG